MTAAARIDSASWTGLPSEIRPAAGPYGDIMTEAQDAAMYRESCREDRRQRVGALAMLWGPPIVDQASTRRRTDGVVDYSRRRQKEWTLWRGILATVAIVLNRRHGRRQAVLQKRRSGSSYVASLDLGYWSARSDGYGYSAMLCWLYPGVRVEIISDGESWL